MQSLDELFALLTDELIEEVRVGADIDPAIIINGEETLRAAVHCCVNGPVGIGKVTTFPGIDREIKIRELFSARITNKAWKKLCVHVADYLERQLNQAQKSQMQSYVLHGAFWPNYDDLN